jgi:hypothetical protein
MPPAFPEERTYQLSTAMKGPLAKAGRAGPCYMTDGKAMGAVVANNGSYRATR